MNNIEVMRTAIMTVPKYDTPSWRARVREMPDNRVYAIYRSFYQHGYFDKPKRQNKNLKPENWRQMDIFDFI